MQLSLTQKAMQALTNAMAEVVDEHRRRANPLAVWRDGKAVWISATEAAALREIPNSLPDEGKERLKAKC